jgi:hypothetical protein
MRTHPTLLLALAVLFTTGCPEKQIKSFSPAHDQESLAASAQLFWHSLRWSDYESAAALLEDSGPRIEFLTDWSSKPPAQITDFQLVHIEVTEPAPDAVRLEGQVIVKVEGISTGSYTVNTEMLRQTWYRSGEHWYLDPAFVPFEEQ